MQVSVYLTEGYSTWQTFEKAHPDLIYAMIPGSHRPSSSTVINFAGTIKCWSPKLHRRRWLGRWISKSFDVHRPSSSPNHVSFLLCRKRCKDQVSFKYFLFTFLSHEITFLVRKEVWKRKVSEKWKKLDLRAFYCNWYVEKTAKNFDLQDDKN